MNDLKIFKNREFGQVRVVEQNGEPWFVGKDVAEILGYKDTSDALKRHIDEEDKLTRYFTDSGQRREMYAINESGLYSLILSSKLPTAKQFKRWVTSEVLPSIRRSGSYAAHSNQQSERNNIMLMNAKVRVAATYLKMADVDTVSKEYKNILVAKAAEVLAGETILPLPKQERKTYSAREVGDMIGISANKVGKLANTNNLKSPEYGEMYRSKSEYSNKEVDTWRYYESVVAVLTRIISQEVA